MTWFNDRRRDWIAEALRVYGFVNREHLKRKFGISSPQAAVDLKRFTTERPGEMTYNVSTKRYEATTPPKSEENDR